MADPYECPRCHFRAQNYILASVEKGELLCLRCVASELKASRAAVRELAEGMQRIWATACGNGTDHTNALLMLACIRDFARDIAAKHLPAKEGE